MKAIGKIIIIGVIGVSIAVVLIALFNVIPMAF